MSVPKANSFEGCVCVVVFFFNISRGISPKDFLFLGHLSAELVEAELKKKKKHTESVFSHRTTHEPVLNLPLPKMCFLRRLTKSPLFLDSGQLFRIPRCLSSQCVEPFLGMEEKQQLLLWASLLMFLFWSCNSGDDGHRRWRSPPSSFRSLLHPLPAALPWWTNQELASWQLKPKYFFVCLFVCALFLFYSLVLLFQHITTSRLTDCPRNTILLFSFRELAF